MIFDATLLLSDAQAITATAASTNYIDLGATGTPVGGVALARDIGPGHSVPLSVTVGAAFNTLTSLTISLETDDNTGFSSAKTVASVTYALARLTVGAVLDFPDYVPQGVNERYFQLRYTVVGSNPTTGNITAGVVAAKQTNTRKVYSA